MVLTVFTTCASSTQIPSTIWQSLQRSVCRRWREQINECTCRNASISAYPCNPLLPPLMDCWVWGQWLPWILASRLTTKWWQHIHGSENMSIIGITSLRCGLHIDSTKIDSQSDDVGFKNRQDTWLENTHKTRMFLLEE